MNQSRSHNKPPALPDGPGFQFWMPVDLCKSQGAPGDSESPGSMPRIGGIASAEGLDHVAEEVIQDGLDWDYFLQYGWFKWEHPQKGKSSDPADLVGFPDLVEQIVLESGHKATRVEGPLINTPMAKDMMQVAQALQEAPGNRRLGFSVEGVIIKRADNKIPKAIIRDVVVTPHPTHPDARLELLARSLLAAQQPAAPSEDASGSQGALSKGGLDAGHPSPADKPGKGAALIPQSLAGLTKDQAILRVLKRLPDLSYAQGEAVISELLKACKKE